MNWKKIIAVFALVGMIVGCAPSIVVENRTRFAVRVVVTTAEGSEVVSPTPGESSSVNAAEGRYTATAIPDADWIEYAKLTRRVLNDQLANSENLSGAQLLDVIRRLKEIAERMDQFTKAASASASCAGAVTSDSSGTVTISTSASGALVVSCK